MARDLDATLLESVRVRRRRLSDAFLHGTLRTRRTTTDNIRRLVVGVILAAIACAVCAGVAFVKAHIHDANSLGPSPVAHVASAPIVGARR